MDTDHLKPSLIRVLNALRAAGGDGLTPKDLWVNEGVYRTSARIYELRRAGYLIAAHRRPHNPSICVYILMAEPEQVAA